MAWDYYNSRSMIHSVYTIVKDFMWPFAVSFAKVMNASPYTMVATNVGGIAWTIYNCFFCEHDDLEEHAAEKEVEEQLGLNSKATARLTFR